MKTRFIIFQTIWSLARTQAQKLVSDGQFLGGPRIRLEWLNFVWGPENVAIHSRTQNFILKVQMKFEAKIFKQRKNFPNFWWNFHFYFWFAFVRFPLKRKILIPRLKYRKLAHRKLKGWRMQFMRHWWPWNGPEKIGSGFFERYLFIFAWWYES